MVHRGEEVKKQLIIKGVNLTKLADKMGIRRQTLYNQLDKANMAVGYISQIGEIIGVDFSVIVPEMRSKGEKKEGPQELEFLDSEELDVMVSLDGSEETLQKVISKLERINKSLMPSS